MTTYTIPAGNLFMNATLYTGNGSSQSIVNGPAGASFQPDFVWVKNRSTAGTDHVLSDSVRGGNGTTLYRLFSDLTNAESANNSNAIATLNSNGFTVAGVSPYAEVNANGSSYIGWQWKAGGTAVSNTSGTITSSVSANTTSGFSISTFTSPSSGTASFGHGLGVTPYFVIVKSRASGNWITQHTSTGTQYMTLNGTGAATTDSTVWNSAPTSSVVNIGTGFAGTVNYVAYCWTPIAGYSAFGSYTGNGSVDGPFVYLGFLPKFLLVKCSSGASTNWVMYDSTRNPYNGVTYQLYPSGAYAEGVDSNGPPFFLSNGFKMANASSATLNTSGQTYIYAAFAANPFKYSNAF